MQENLPLLSVPFCKFRQMHAVTVLFNKHIKQREAENFMRFDPRSRQDHVLKGHFK